MMLLEILLVLHIAVLGYWLGSEFVINSTFRYVCLSPDMPFKERNRLLEHVMVADQHVRYALILQLTLGFMLAALLGYLPGTHALALTSLGFGAAWLALVETTHRLRHSSSGQKLAKLDRMIRYFLMAGLAVMSLSAYVLPTLPLPHWLSIKLFCFVAVMGCGVGIRLVIIRLYKVWKQIEIDGTNQERELYVKKFYTLSTGILLLLWLFIITITGLSIWKPL